MFVLELKSLLRVGEAEVLRTVVRIQLEVDLMMAGLVVNRSVTDERRKYETFVEKTHTKEPDLHIETPIGLDEQCSAEFTVLLLFP